MQIDETIHVPVSAREQFEGKIAWINRRAKQQRMGLEVRLEVLGEEPRPITVTRRVFRDGGFEQATTMEQRPCVLYRLTCLEPKVALPGWSFAGWITAKNSERDTVSGAVRAHSYAPGADGEKVAQEVLDGAFNERGMMRCDHCRTFRNRRIGIVIRNATGETQIVGSACARDYLGHDYTALIAYHQHITYLRQEYDREREQGWYKVVETDWEAERRARADAQARRDAMTYPLRRIIAAIVEAMVKQGFYARYTGSGRIATAAAAVEILEARQEPSEAVQAAVERVLAWLRSDGRFAAYSLYKGLGEDPERVLSLAAYREVDPDFALVTTYAGRDVPLIGTIHQGKVEIELSYTGEDEAPDVQIETTRGVKTVGDRARILLKDREGAIYQWDTTSTKLDDVLAPGMWFPAAFEVKRSWVKNLRAHHAITRLTRAKVKAA
jgi:hypothetical protein